MDRVEEPGASEIRIPSDVEAEVSTLLEYYDAFGPYERAYAGDRIATMAHDARVRRDHDQADRLYTLASAVVTGRLVRLTRKNTG